MISLEDKAKYQKMNQAELDQAYICACRRDKFNEVQYLLTSPELKEYANIHAYQDEGFIQACLAGNLKIVKYLLTSPELKEYANIHAQNDYGFIYACRNEHLKIIDYLVIEQNMNISGKLNQEMKKKNHETYEYALKLIETRDLADNMNSELKEKSNKVLKAKL